MNSSNSSLPRAFDNVYLSTTIIVLLVLYASMLGPELPPMIKSLFNNNIFKIIVLFLLVVRGNSDPMLSISIVIIFVMTVDYLNADELIEKIKKQKETMKNL